MISESILHIGLAQSLFAAFVLATKRRVKISDKILIMCLLTFALKFLLLLFYNEHAEFFDLEFSMGLVPMTFGPYMYLYTSYLVSAKTRFNYRDYLHFVPFFIITVAYFSFFKDVVSFNDVTYFDSDEYLWVRMLYGLCFFTSIVVYTTLTFIKLREYRKGLAQHFSYWSRPLQLLWLNFIPMLFSLFFLTYFITGGINAVFFKKVVDTATLSHVGLTIIAFLVSYFGLRQPSLFRSIELKEEKLNGHEEPAPSVEITEDKKIIVKPRFTPAEAQTLVAKLTRHMENEKPYLNAELTLYDLASQINLTKNELTDILNIHIGKNFFSYINEFRLNAVIRKLENPEFDHYTIIAIAYDCGFNSKSTFNNLFKQHTGFTPSEYKKSKTEKAQ